METRPRDATASVIARHQAVRASLPFEDQQDFADAARGFIATLPDAQVTAASGRVVWSLAAYGFLDTDDAPPTVDPSLWRQSRLNMHHGLFAVVPGVYQVRGLDIANMTLVEGETGVIVIDCLTSIEGARAALALYRAHRDDRPVRAVIFTHTHTDHWGGAEGVLDGATDIPVIAPDLFLQNAVSENVLAGPGMMRRAQYQFGHFLAKGPRGHVDCGLGKTMATGAAALVRPTDLIRTTGETRTLDGVRFEFQMAPNTEAPAEMHFYLPALKVLNLAENCTHNFHNLLPFRGADVRDARAWSHYLNEALDLWGDRAEVMCGQHHWPVWGNERVTAMIRVQRDLYKFVHDQTVRLMNHGLTATEIAETLRLPDSLDRAWHARGYYGHLRHNVKAIYQKYLGWYDANPASLDPLPPVEAGRKYVEYMGGAAAILGRAQADFANGEFRFVAQALSHLVFAEPGNTAARALLADTFEQLGYAAESATWRCAYLFGAQELRQGMPSVPPRPPIARATLAALTMPLVWDWLGIRLNGPRAAGQAFITSWTLTDSGEQYALTLENAALSWRPRLGTGPVDASFTLTREALDGLLLKERQVEQEVAEGRIACAGDPRVLNVLLDLLDEFPRMFEIVEPKRRLPDPQ